MPKNDERPTTPSHERHTTLSSERPSKDGPQRNPENLDDELYNQNGAGVPPTKDMLDEEEIESTVNDGH
ncbi:MAG: hypothetical protein AAGJ82_12125 [Bacteroidota bacterium]